MSLIRRRAKSLITAGIIGALIAIIPCALIIGYLFVKNAEYVEEVPDSSYVYVLTTNVEADQLIEDNHLQKNKISGYTPSYLYEASEIIGKRARLSLNESTIITGDLLYEGNVLTDDLRIHNYNCINIPEQLFTGDYIDIRIVFPSGKDFIVASKKKVIDITENNIRLEIYEEEILRLSSAVVDAYLNQGHIYAIKYVDVLQKAAIINYPVNKDIEELIRNNPNIVELATNVLISELRTTLEEEFTNPKANEDDQGLQDENFNTESDWDNTDSQLID